MDSEQHVERKQQTPLPYGQLFQVLAIQSSEPITATVIYPFITHLITRTGVTHGDQARVGYFAGILESVFFVAESSTCYLWGVASDKWGRRPILLIGPLGLALAMVLFGLSNTFWLLVVLRAAKGMFNGNIGVSKTIMAEITDSTNIADVYTMIPVMWAFGITVGPVIGGLLAEPAKNWPHVFGHLRFFQQFPYFLPCFVGGLYAFLTFLIPLFGLKETHPVFKHRGHTPDPEEAETVPSGTRPLPTDQNEAQPLLSDQDEVISYDATSTSSSLTQTEEQPSSTPPPVLNPSLRIVFANYILLTFIDMSYSVIIPLFFSTKNALGGLGFTTRRTGTIMAIYSLSNGFLQIVVFKKILKRVGPRRMYQITYACEALPFVMIMLEQMMVNHHGKVTAGIWPMIVIQFLSASFANTAYSAIHVLIVQSAHPETMGSVNGLAQALASGSRAFAPFIASSLFALSLDKHILGGYFVHVFLIATVILGTVFCSIKLPKH